MDSAISPFLEGRPILVISCDVIDELKELYSDRILVLDSFFGLCDKFDISLKGRIENLIKITAMYEVEDKDTYVVADDDYIIKSVNKTTHKAISVNEAIKLLKEKGLFVDRGVNNTKENI